MVNITSMCRLRLRGDFRLSHILQFFVKLIFEFCDLCDIIEYQTLQDRQRQPREGKSGYDSGRGPTPRTTISFLSCTRTDPD